MCRWAPPQPIHPAPSTRAGDTRSHWHTGRVIHTQDTFFTCIYMCRFHRKCASGPRGTCHLHICQCMSPAQKRVYVGTDPAHPRDDTAQLATGVYGTYKAPRRQAVVYRRAPLQRREHSAQHKPTPSSHPSLLSHKPPQAESKRVSSAARFGNLCPLIPADQLPPWRPCHTI